MKEACAAVESTVGDKAKEKAQITNLCKNHESKET